ncbi:MAG: NAD-dependent epimerase/dehydratase family protein [Anaerolineales bacterium]|nr:NAD-dependent epimerase/dehydratase family protein [Anaerolineales bacterium]
MTAAGHFDAVIDMICYLPEEADSDVRAFRGRCDHLIFCSTVDVYSKPAHHYPYCEDEPRNAISLYGQNKVKCEDIFLAAHARGDFPVTIIRPAMTYGEGGVIVHTFGWNTTYLDRIRKGKPIVVPGDGQSLWVTCHVDDVARAFVAAIGNARAFGKAYHTTGDEWLTWDQFHQGVARALGAPAPRLVHIPSDLLAIISPDAAAITTSNFQYSNIYDNAAARADLDFRQTIL